MKSNSKSEFLQIRVSPQEKKDLQEAAKKTGQGLSAFVLARLLPGRKVELQAILQKLSKGHEQTLVWTHLHEFLETLNQREFADVVDKRPIASLSLFQENFFAALIEQFAMARGFLLPDWLADVKPLADPYFASSLQSLRLHLLLTSPPAFRRRNLFVDATGGDRV